MSYSILLKAKQIKKNFLRDFTDACVDEDANCVTSSTFIALIDKVEHIIENKGDFEGAIRMLNSFKNGTKRLPTDKYRDGDGYRRMIWKDSAHGKYQIKPQLPRAHFRWNYGERYTLTVDEFIIIEKFLKKHGLNHL